jgi:hypothetical protein
MKMPKILFAALLWSGLAACVTAPSLRSDYDRQADFAQFHTFGYMSTLGTDRAGYSSLLTERLKTATRRQMEMRGYRYVASNPDLLINFNGKLEEKTQVIPGPSPIGPYFSYRSGSYTGWPDYGFGGHIFPYTVGILNIDLIDARRQQLVWEGVLEGEVQNLDSIDTPEKVEQNVAQIFSQYPFRAGSAQVWTPESKK